MSRTPARWRNGIGCAMSDMTSPLRSSQQICLGGSVFGWLISRSESWAILDRFCEIGGRHIDTSDGYSSAQRADRLDSESIIGDWIRAAGVEDEMKVCTKVGLCPEYEGLRLGTVREAVDRSLERVGVPQFEAVLAHADDSMLDPSQIAESLSVVVNRRQARGIGISGFDAARARAVAEAAQSGFQIRIGLIQEEFSVVRPGYLTSELRDAADSFGMRLMATGALAQGFLTGKFHATEERVGHRQNYAKERYADSRSQAALERVRKVATNHSVPMAAVALACIAVRYGQATPVASVTRPEQLDSFFAAAQLQLTESEADFLFGTQTPR